jgi:hypothetical protein
MGRPGGKKRPQKADNAFWNSISNELVNIAKMTNPGNMSEKVFLQKVTKRLDAVKQKIAKHRLRGVNLSPKKQLSGKPNAFRDGLTATYSPQPSIIISPRPSFTGTPDWKNPKALSSETAISLFGNEKKANYAISTLAEAYVILAFTAEKPTNKSEAAKNQSKKRTSAIKLSKALEVIPKDRKIWKSQNFKNALNALRSGKLEEGLELLKRLKGKRKKGK